MSLPIRPPNHGAHVPAQQSMQGMQGMPFPLPAPPTAPSMAIPDEADPLLDMKLVRDILGFPLRCVRRHLRATLLTAAATIVVVALVIMLVPREYAVQTRILAQRNIGMPALTNPNRTVPTEADAPAKLAGETVHKRENVVQIIRETNLLTRWDQIRSPVGKIKDRIKSVVSRPPTDAERLDMMVEFLNGRIWVAPPEGPDGALVIGVNWPDAPSALAIVERAQENFFQERYSSEVARIGESITLMERYVAQSRATMDSTLQVLAAQAPLPPRSAMPRAPTRAAMNPEVAGLRATLAARRVVIQDLVASRADQLNRMQGQLADLRKSLGSANPDVKAAERTIAAMTGDTPQLTALRAEERTIVSRLAALGAPEVAVPDVQSQAEPLLARAALERLARSDVLNDPQEAYAQAQLKITIDKYEDFLGRLESARIELETARSAFKYRYNVVTPPQLPKKPVKPKIPFLVAGGVFLAVALSVFVAIVLDLIGGRVLENWQVERMLKLPVLGTVERL